MVSSPPPTDSLSYAGGNKLTQNYRSCPIRMESLRNSLRESLASKRNSLTDGELLFVEDTLRNESVDQDELEKMHSVLSCNHTFFDHSEEPSSVPEARSEEEVTTTVSEDDTAAEGGNSSTAGHCPKHGSKKRQNYLEARKKQAANESKKRAQALWKKASLATRTVTKLAKLARDKEEGEETVNDQALETKDTTEEETEEAPKTMRPVFLRKASVNAYGGEGIEIDTHEAEDWFRKTESSEKPQEEKKDQTEAEEEDEELDEKALQATARSFAHLSTADETKHEGFRRASVNIYGGAGFEVADEGLLESVYDGDDRLTYEYYDPWLFQEFDKDGKRRDFTILGTSHDDHSCHPHVLSPIQMDRLQPYLPESKRGESFWLKYSLVRDGASTISFLQKVRASPYTLLAMETVDGEVFGGFFANAWTVQPAYYGTGESFLWRMKEPRELPADEVHDDSSFCGNGTPRESSQHTSARSSLVDQIAREADLEIFASEIYYGNRYFQRCQQDTIAAGGGATSLPQEFHGKTYEAHEIGFGLRLGEKGSLLVGNSSASLTFRNPPLAGAHHGDGSTFELVNLEAWGFTPCQTEDEARILEYKNMFFRKHSSGSI